MLKELLKKESKYLKTTRNSLKNLLKAEFAKAVDLKIPFNFT
jgi:hypothetical protein